MPHTSTVFLASLAPATIVAGVVGYGTLILLGSGASQPIAPPPPVLLPARERPAVVVSPIPDSPTAPTHDAIKKHPNYPELPQRIKVAISDVANEPTWAR